PPHTYFPYTTLFRARHMRIINLNVNGIQAAAERGLLSWLQAQNADVFCLQDTRASVYDLEDPAYQLDGYYLYAAEAEVPSQGGVDRKSTRLNSSHVK